MPRCRRSSFRHRSVLPARSLSMPTELWRRRRAALFALSMVLAGVGWWAAKRLTRREDPLASGRSAYEREAWAEAAGRAREALRAAPSSTEAVRLLARSSVRLG